jgi:predicted amidohydrolase
MTETLIEKVRKLLALAESPNENEAALAAEKAQELMLRHGIDMAQVAAASGKSTIGAEEGKTRGKVDPWRRTLAHHVAKSMGGRIVYANDYGSQSGTIYWFGPSGTIEAMTELYAYLEGTLVNLSAIATAKREETWIHGRRWRTSFLAGAVQRIGRRLAARRKTIEAEADYCCRAALSTAD